MCLPGRLKLRQGNIEQTLIFYNRPDQEGPKQSDFYLSKMTDGTATENLLEKALGVKVVVDKYRKDILHRQRKVSPR
jgi:adenylate cyclase class 2